MIENNIADGEISKLKRVITQKTRPETSNILDNVNLAFNNLNSVLKNVKEDNVVQYINIPKTETAKIEDHKSKEISPDDKNNQDILMLKTNRNKNNNKNIDLFFLPKRVDRFGTAITQGGKQKVTFIDRITKNNFVEVIKIENFKEFNKMEEISKNKTNNCCMIT